MSNQFATIPVPSANGSGAPVDVSTYGATKTFTVSSDNDRQPPTITLEFNNAASSSDGSWQAIKSFQGGGQLTIDLACRWVRATVTNYRSGASRASIGGTDAGSEFVNLPTTPGNGTGTPVDVSALGLFKTVQSSKPSRGSTQIEISNDGGTSWSTLISFNGPSSSSAVFSADMMRVTRNGVPVVDPGQPEVNVGACDIAGGGGIQGIELENVGVPLAGGPFNTLNLVGAVATDAGDGTALVTITGGGGGASFINVRDFGAVGDGVTDDHDALMDAFAAGVAASLPVYFPQEPGDAGEYYTATSLTLTSAFSNLKLIAVGRAGIKKDTTLHPAIILENGFSNLECDGMFFFGPANDDKDVNFYAACEMHASATDVRFVRCTFEQVGTPFAAFDSAASSRLTMDNCLMHNVVGGIHPCNDTKIVNCYFICDEIVATRAQAIYMFGSFNNILISGCTFRRIRKQAIQIRAVEAQWAIKQNFRIVNNTFIECQEYAIFCGSDAYPNVTQLLVENNSFKDCLVPINCQGQGSAQITGNIIAYTWEWPFGPAPFTNAITASTGVGLSGHYNARCNVNIVGNKLTMMHPFFAKVVFDTNPEDGDTITVGEFTYTFKTVAAAPNDIPIQATTRETVDFFVSMIRGFGDQAVGPNNVIRTATDSMNNFFGATSEEQRTAIIVGGKTFPDVTQTGGFATIDATVELRQACPYPIQVQFLTAPLIANNILDDFLTNIVVQNCRGGEVYDNHGTCQGTPAPCMIIAQYNVDMRYRGNRCINLDALNQGSCVNNQYFDAWSVIDDDMPVIQEGYTQGGNAGRSGTVDIGDGKAYSDLWYGRGINPADDYLPPTIPFRWNDGDVVRLFDGAMNHDFTYKFDTPGAGEFNSADGLVALLGAVSGFDAAYAPFVNRLSTEEPKIMIRIKAAAMGTALNAARLYVFRPIAPGEASTNVPQPLINGYILRNIFDSETYQRFGGGAAALTSTFVFTPLANPQRGISVWGVDAPSVALSPVVYQDDIVPGVGFKITHLEGTGAEKFGFRVNQ